MSNASAPSLTVLTVCARRSVNGNRILNRRSYSPVIFFHSNDNNITHTHALAALCSLSVSVYNQYIGAHATRAFDAMHTFAHHNSTRITLIQFRLWTALCFVYMHSTHGNHDASGCSKQHMPSIFPSNETQTKRFKPECILPLRTLYAHRIIDFIDCDTAATPSLFYRLFLTANIPYIIRVCTQHTIRKCSCVTHFEIVL